MSNLLVKNQALNLIDQYCGSTAYDLYGKFYQDLPEDKIKASLKQLLTEVVGQQKTIKLMKTVANPKGEK